MTSVDGDHKLKAMADLSGKRVLLLGAETELGAEIARALADTGASLALIAASNDPQTAFAVQRLARNLGAPVAQAIDAANEMAVRVMVRQVSKELGGLDGVVFSALSSEEVDRLPWGLQALGYLLRFGGREIARRGNGCVVGVVPGVVARDVHILVEAPVPPQARAVSVGMQGKTTGQVTREVLAALAAPSS